MTLSSGAARARRFGIVLVTASAIMFSFAGVLTKAVESDAWTITCWRGLLGGLLILAYVAWASRGRSLRRAFRLGWQGWILATVGSFASLAFIFSFKLTYVANVAIIYAAAPFLAAGLGWLFLAERLRAATLLAAAFSLTGVGVVVAGGISAGNVLGDGVALLMTLGNALYIVLIRLFRESPVVLAGGVSGLQL